MELFNSISLYILTWLAHLVLLAGVVVYTVGIFMPTYNKIAVKTLAVVLIFVGAFLEGNLYSTKKHLAEVAQLQEQIKRAESQSAQVNTVIETKYIDRVKVIGETTDANIEYVDRVVTQYDSTCALSNAVIGVHNTASQNQAPGSTGSPDEGTSDVKASDLIRTVTENYGTCYEIREQLQGWQRWYREQQKIHSGIK